MVLSMKHTTKKKKSQEGQNSNSLPVLFPDTAGIDIGSKSHFVAVPSSCDSNSVREFSTFTADLHKMINWLKECKIKHVVMESTGVYWIPTFELLESNGFDVKLVNARHVKNVSAHKTDVLDCQWLQQLGTFGLLKGAFRPADASPARLHYKGARHAQDHPPDSPRPVHLQRRGRAGEAGRQDRGQCRRLPRLHRQPHPAADDQ
jgi:hypothetical protein